MKYILKTFNLVFILSLMTTHFCVAQTARPLFQNKKFVLYADSVVQGKYTAQVLSSTELTSNYQSQANLFKSNKIDFKSAFHY
jgi:hypothetical protein